MIGWRRVSPAYAWVAGLLAAYFATRLIALTALPIFFDETGHIRWAIWISQGQKLDKPWQYGKGLPIFANALLFPWARAHYLWASRALTVLFGAGTLAGAVLIGRALGGERTGWLAGLFYVACPYALVYDRLALTDPALGTFAAFVALLSLRLAERWRARDGIALGAVLALAVFAKALGVLLFFAPAAAVLLVAPRRLRRPWPLLAAYVVAGASTAVPLLRYFQVTATVRVAVSKSDAGLADRLAANLPLGGSWLWGYWTSGLILLAAFALARAVAVRARPVVFVATLIAVPTLAFAAVGDIWFPRYLVFLTAPFVALAGWGASEAMTVARNRAGGRGLGPILGAALALILLPAARLDFMVLFDPAHAGWVDLDRFQYVTGWPSGYGVRDTIAIVREERARHPEGITVVTHSRTVRTTARALDLEFAYGEGVRIEDLNFDEPEGAMPLLAEWAAERPTLVVIEPAQAKSRRPDPALFAGLRGDLVARTFKPDGALCDEIYRLCGGQRCSPPAP
ncbi:MAG TPA: glycosyltransferase family 39 protein [Vicinamibacteria bacterium]|nr:glycosyltransferase family 39 protein [Vicinamibacteria bacterium]